MRIKGMDKMVGMVWIVGMVRGRVFFRCDTYGGGVCCLPRYRGPWHLINNFRSVKVVYGPEIFMGLIRLKYKCVLEAHAWKGPKNYEIDEFIKIYEYMKKRVDRGVKRRKYKEKSFLIDREYIHIEKEGNLIMSLSEVVYLIYEKKLMNINKITQEVEWSIRSLARINVKKKLDDVEIYL